MRIRVLSAAVLWLMVSPGIVQAQSFDVHASAGPTVTDPGYSFAAGAGFSPTRHLTFSVNVERTQLLSQTTSDGRGGFSGFRGGTLVLGSGELQVTPLGHDRLGPYGVVGFATGVSRPNVNASFPDPVTNSATALFFGGGVHVPINPHLAVFAEARMMIGAEGPEGILAIVPVRGGISWRF
jgi:hypothetical protein